MIAILSDVHGNLEALRAVLDDISRQHVDDIFNLGDITGYGPNPIECIDLSMEMAVVLKGEFDEAVLRDGFVFPPSLEKCVLWTRQLLGWSGDEGPATRRRLAFLERLESSRREQDALYVHGSPRNPRNEYIFVEDTHNRSKMARIGEAFEGICFNGHTHLPGIFIESDPGQWQFLKPNECGSVFRPAGRKVICNVGSVGQPRDGDWRAAYVVFDGSTIRFHRVEYDIETTIQKIYADPHLASFYGDRLRDGR